MGQNSLIAVKDSCQPFKHITLLLTSFLLDKILISDNHFILPIMKSKWLL